MPTGRIIVWGGYPPGGVVNYRETGGYPPGGLPYERDMPLILSILVYLSSILQYRGLSYRIYQPGGASHGSDARRLGNPLSGGGAQFAYILILPVLFILPYPRP